MNFAQFYCSVADLIADMEKPGGDESRLYQAIRDASDVLQKEIGWFIPVTQTIKMRGNGQQKMFVSPPILALTGSVTNDETTLVTDTDFSLMPAEWANGPAIGLEIRTDYGSVWYATDPDSVQIPCRAGLYERSSAIGATVQDSASQSSSQTTLKVSNGGKVSPGMVLKIGDEQELVTGWGDPTASVTTLNGAVTATEDVITVANGALVNVGEIIRVQFEQMRVKDKRTHQLYVDRGWNNTGQTAHVTSTAVDIYRTVNVDRGVNGTTAAAHLLAVDIYRYHTPDDILFLTKQIATLMINKARGGYAGKTGNAEMGETYYHDVFPRFEIERVKINYMLGKL
jgi:hypothetical protein